MTEQPPAAVTEDLDRLQAALVAVIPARTESNLLVATWNVRVLGDLTAKWVAGPKDAPKRDWHAIACLAGVISRFDVVAVQESRRNPLALKRLLAPASARTGGLSSRTRSKEPPATANASPSCTTAPGSSPRAWSGRSCCPCRG
jgi:hypothetical protein